MARIAPARPATPRSTIRWFLNYASIFQIPIATRQPPHISLTQNLENLRWGKPAPAMQQSDYKIFFLAQQRVLLNPPVM
jgi:hypothetical protein